MDSVPGLSAYAEKVGADRGKLYAFSQSLSKLQTSDGSSSAPCLVRFSDTPESRNNMLDCLSLRGLAGLNKEFLETLVGIRLDRLQRVHIREAAQSLRLLNWLFDIAVEQYNLSSPTSFWLEKNRLSGTWRFVNREEKNHDDYKFQEGDLILSISPSELSTLIPQYTLPERRLTHSMIYRGARDHRKDHFIESEFEEGVRYKYRDTYRNKDKPYETFVLRYASPEYSKDDLLQIRKNAADFAASHVGMPYSFGTDKKIGFSCHFLTGLSFVEGIQSLFPNKQETGFEDMHALLGGFSPLRKGLSRIYAAKFGMAEDLTDFPTAGDYLSSSHFEVQAMYIRADMSRRFSDLYTVAESTVDAMDRGATIVISPELLANIEPMMRDRALLREVIRMVRQMKRHTIMRTAIKEANVSLELIEQLSVAEFKNILARLDEERKVLKEATSDEVGITGRFNVGSNAFGEAEDLSKKDHSKMKIGRFLAELNSRGAGKITAQDFSQLKLFMANLDLAGIKKVVNYGEKGMLERIDKNFLNRVHIDPSPKDFSKRMPVIGAVLRAIDQLVLSEEETAELTESLRTYALFLLSTQALQTKVIELEAKDVGTLQNVIKQAPFIASALDNETLIEFGTYKKMASGIVEKYETIREKTNTQYLWQTPPWIQRNWVEFILPQVSVINYK